jgi:hypothetical protein
MLLLEIEDQEAEDVNTIRTITATGKFRETAPGM